MTWRRFAGDSERACQHRVSPLSFRLNDRRLASCVMPRLRQGDYSAILPFTCGDARAPNITVAHGTQLRDSSAAAGNSFVDVVVAEDSGTLGAPR